MSEKLVLLSSVRLDYPFQLGIFVKKSEKSVFYHRLNYHPELDDVLDTRKNNVYAIVDYSKLDQLQEIQKKFSEKWWSLEKERDSIIKDFKDIGLGD